MFLNLLGKKENLRWPAYQMQCINYILVTIISIWKSYNLQWSIEICFYRINSTFSTSFDVFSVVSLSRPSTTTMSSHSIHRWLLSCPLIMEMQTCMLLRVLLTLLIMSECLWASWPPKHEINEDCFTHSSFLLKLIIHSFPKVGNWDLIHIIHVMINISIKD